MMLVPCHGVESRGDVIKEQVLRTGYRPASVFQLLTDSIELASIALSRSEDIPIIKAIESSRLLRYTIPVQRYRRDRA
jgi:hypothetical protein